MVDRENPNRASLLPLPPKLVLSLLALSVALRLFVETEVTTSPWRLAAGIVTALAGLSLTLAAARHFERRRANIVTFEPPSELVVDGWFRVSRNPMYLGFAILLAGAALALGGLFTFLPAALFVGAAEAVYIPFEERAMTQAFGDDYLRYSKQVRRWFGRRSARVAA
jgi:protein-S-isoprenylcysteine O-methyltransferase Ste14